eukprot:SAG11_NODE_13077_length_671_cov_1.169580_1_plen_143_part_10
MLTLKRFTWKADGTAAKIRRRVAVPLWLWLPVSRVAGAGDTAVMGAAEAAQRSTVRYELYAVVVHSGGSANSGHYYTYARHLRPTSSSLCNGIAVAALKAMCELHHRLWLVAELDVDLGGERVAALPTVGNVEPATEVAAGEA